MGSGSLLQPWGSPVPKGNLRLALLEWVRWAIRQQHQAQTARKSSQGQGGSHHQQSSKEAGILPSMAIYHPVLDERIKEFYSCPAAIHSRSRQGGHLSYGKCLWKAQSSGTYPASCRLVWVTQTQVTEANSKGASLHRWALQASVNEIKENLDQGRKRRKDLRQVEGLMIRENAEQFGAAVLQYSVGSQHCPLLRINVPMRPLKSHC